jgi:hypothetical protein
MENPNPPEFASFLRGLFIEYFVQLFPFIKAWNV